MKSLKGTVATNQASQSAAATAVLGFVGTAATAQGRKTTPKSNKNQRCADRSAWLERQCTMKGWSVLDVAQHGGPAYNTIQRWRSGKTSTRDAYVRGRLARALGCDHSAIPF